MTHLVPSGNDMPREVRARFSNGRIEPLEELDLQEGEEVVILVKDTPSSASEPLFGLIPGGVIKGDIISPLEDLEWDALS